MRRDSLRRRIFVAFAGAGLILGPLVAIAILFLTVESQERLAERELRRDLQAVLAGGGPENLRLLQDTDGNPVHTNVERGQVPAVLLELPDGLHEHESGELAWLVVARTTASGRVVLFRDIAAIEERERQGVFYGAVGGLLALFGGMLCASRVSRRLAGPLESLTRRIARADAADDASCSVMARDLPNDEIGMLAKSLDAYLDRVRRALERERNFSADISHELRNPLAVIRSAAEVVDADPDTPARSRRALQRLDLAAMRMQETVNTLLELLREQNHRDAWPATDVAERVRSVLEQEHSTITATEVVVREQLRPGTTVQAPPAVVDAVVGNLVRNALQHSGCRHLSVYVDAHSVCVTDDGIGMPGARSGAPSDAASDAGGLAGKSEDDGASPAGSGLGLSLVHRLCARFGWRLDIDSAPERGTRATLWFA